MHFKVVLTFQPVCEILSFLKHFSLPMLSMLHKMVQTFESQSRKCLSVIIQVKTVASMAKGFLATMRQICT